ncbi:MAG: hypothetical protein LQ346_003059 [Caloplaca aetnensis]|nr:MAG: hypothetical protein LQ346_003059 [Caloplaca aetnensis]
MAPVNSHTPLSLSSLGLNTRVVSRANNLKRVDSTSPLEAGSYLFTRDGPADDHRIPHGNGAFDPQTINNRGFFALFAILGAAMVLASIWFFFWAKNGGFHFKQGDWDEYKSTVLRRKGPNGTTLSGATRTTDLGGGSIVAAGSRDGDFEDVPINEKEGKKKAKKARKAAPRGSKNNHDEDVRAYRHEKPARVGGLNRAPDASYPQETAYTPTEPTESEMSQSSYTPFVQNFVPINTPRKKADKKGAKTPTRNGPSSTFYSHTPGSTDSHRPLRAHQYEDSSNNSTPTRSRQSSPRKHARQPSIPGSYDSYTQPIDFESRYASTEAGETDNSRGTKAYFHPIPGLAGGGNGGSGQRASGHGGYGFRRAGARGRRDSLSDSEGETMAS